MPSTAMDATNWIDVSAELGSPAIRIFAGSTPKGVEEAEARKWAIECINISLEHAAKRGPHGSRSPPH